LFQITRRQEIGTLSLASVRWQLFPPTTLFLPLLDRLCLSFVTCAASLTEWTYALVKPGKSLPGRFPSTHITKCCLSILGG
jgi:hypothetical protein